MMEKDPRSEELNKQDTLRPPVSPRPKGQVLPGVPKKSSVPGSCPAAPSGHPEVEVLQKQAHTLRKVHRVVVEELARAQQSSEELHQRLEKLKQQKEALKEPRKKLQELLQRAQLHSEEVKAQGQRKSGICLEQQQGLEGTEQKWEQFLFECREQRWQYCQKLDAITEEFKHLRVTHTPDHLKAELVKLEKMEEKFLNWERCLKKTVELICPEALVAMQLVREEQERAERRLEAELRRQQQSRERRDRLAEELRQLQLSMEAQPE
ncbi:trichohyalin-like [Catharus ustulatus]|uniref:trichohyalin-like n=1 Tax=Catharus ustulatus TaxID=91951 RepID=UPI001409B327|nr:trichohyalin-like [Catharus ustulatus]XP_032939407.1 trichohyalin-like [Catharus ustulatus]